MPPLIYCHAIYATSCLFAARHTRCCHAMLMPSDIRRDALISAMRRVERAVIVVYATL